jgi:predicted  nucleic acid-binding Zn-ribbon protein
VELAPGARIELPVTERLALKDAWVLSRLTAGNLRDFEQRGLLDETSREALERVVALRARIAAVEEQAAAAEREAAEISTDQARFRENVKAMGDRRDARDLVARWLSRADAQETRLQSLADARRQAEAGRRALQDEIDVVVRGLEGERDLRGVSSAP